MNDEMQEILITRYAAARGRVYRAWSRTECGHYRCYRCVGPSSKRFFRPDEAFPVAEREAAIADAKARIAKEIAKTERRLERLRKLEIKEVEA